MPESVAIAGPRSGIVQSGGEGPSRRIVFEEIYIGLAGESGSCNDDRGREKLMLEIVEECRARMQPGADCVLTFTLDALEDLTVSAPERDGRAA